MMRFDERLARRVAEVGAAAMVGIDPHPSRLPGPIAERMADPAAALGDWGCAVIDAVAPVSVGVKPQVGFFEPYGAAGITALSRICAHARSRGLLVLLDAKRGDIGSTAEAYARATLDAEGPVAADAVTLSPYLGPESLAPFVRRVEQGKGLFVLVRTSNPGAADWQSGIAEKVADWVCAENTRLGGASVGAVVGATLSGAPWRERMPSAWFLTPGIGAQGATVDDVAGHRRTDGTGVLAISARGILYGREGREGADWAERVATRARAFATALQ